MRFEKLHSWKVSPREAFSIQGMLRERLIPEDALGEVRLVAGADVACPVRRGEAVGGVIVFEYPSLKIVEKRSAVRPLSFPYVPGLLAFREAPALLAAFDQVREEPDLIIFDAQGTAHPRRMGLASHLGILLDKPSIGCAKSRLTGIHQDPGTEKGSYALLEEKGEIIGAAVRTRRGVKPVYVSIGHRVSLETAMKYVLDCCRGYRLPEPSRQAHNFVTER